MEPHPLHSTLIFMTLTRLEFCACVKEVKAVVGEEADDDVIKDLLLQADMDVNRAINFYFSIN